MNKVELRAIEYAEFIIKNPMPIRKMAKEFNTSKSTVHRGLTLVLKRVDEELYIEIREILKRNKEEGRKRGAVATRIKWQNNKLV